MPGRLVCCLALAVLAVACVPPPEDIDTVVDFDPAETRMGVIQERGVLRVGVPEDPRPPLSFAGPTGYQGFLAELAGEIATALGVEIEFLPVPSEELLALQSVDGQKLDLAFPIVPITQKLVLQKCQGFICRNVSHPYYVAHQRLLVRNGSGVADVENLGGREVCTVTPPGTSVDVRKLNPEVQVIDVNDVGECALLLENGSVDVVSALDVELMTVWATVTDCTQPCPPSPEFSLVGDDMTTVGLGVAMPPGGGWNNFVNETWGETDAEGRWLEFHRVWIEPYGIEVDEAPDMTVEEAAGLFPQGV
ncbi:MAG: transporter substrate-binding domain-containing protein [Actinomycetota bacterium]|nr:transporter substrate-binding domain-containing protein [Actinomycetota bacterium]